MVPIHDIQDAFSFDKTLKIEKTQIQKLKEKYLYPESYSKKKLFDHMYQGKTIVFNNYPVKLNLMKGCSKEESIVQMLIQGLPQNEKIYIRSGPSRNRIRVSIEEVIERWKRGKSKFGVTDLHFRDTNFYHMVDAKAVSFYNLLPRCPEQVSFLEMLTLVISSRGIFSDSHSDDGDGSNHCLLGKKLWFAWDRQEGKKAGLQDCTFDYVYDQAKFSLTKFLSIPSAHWFMVSENQTLFMPGNFAHKVITLEPYIGYGSFYVSLPGYLNTLKRWKKYPTGDVKGDFIKIMNDVTQKKVKQLSRSSGTVQQNWGLNYFTKSLKTWKSGESLTTINYLKSQDDFMPFINSLAEKRDLVDNRVLV